MCVNSNGQLHTGGVSIHLFFFFFYVFFYDRFWVGIEEENLQVNTETGY